MKPESNTTYVKWPGMTQVYTSLVSEMELWFLLTKKINFQQINGEIPVFELLRRSKPCRLFFLWVKGILLVDLSEKTKRETVERLGRLTKLSKGMMGVISCGRERETRFRAQISDREKRTTSKGGPVFSKLIRLDRTDPLSFGPKFPEILVEWIAPFILANNDFLPFFPGPKKRTLGTQIGAKLPNHLFSFS